MALTAEAERVWDLAKSRPAAAIDLAEDLIARAGDDPDGVIALAARGRAHYELGHNDLAIADLDRAAGSAVGAIQSRATIALSAALAAGGHHRRAVQLLEEVVATDDEADATPAIQALALSQLGMLRLHEGDVVTAGSLLERAAAALRTEDDEADGLARVLGNAGYCQLLAGDLDRAVELFDEAIELATATDQHVVVAGCLQNKACALSMLGEFPAALAQLEEARAVYGDLGAANRNLSTLYDDFAETYRLAGLTGDAIDHATRALDLVADGGNLEKTADATYRLAVCLLDHGDDERAVEVAARARAIFDRTGRAPWVTRATLVAVEAATVELVDDPAKLAEAKSAIDELERTGWRTEGLRIRNRLLLIGAAAGDDGHLDRFLTNDLPDGDQSVTGRLERLLHRAIGERRRSGRLDRHLTEARAEVLAHRSRLADPELRAGSGRLTEAFRFLTLDQALSGGDPATVLAAEEQWRAASVRLPRARPSSDPAVATTTRELREVTRQAAEADQPDPGLVERVHQLEERLRRHSHQAAGSASTVAGDPEAPPDPEELAAALSAALGHRRLVEWFGHGGFLHAVELDDDGVRLRRIGPLSELRSAATRIRRDLTRLLQTASPADREARWARLGDRAAALGRRLVGPSAEDRGVVLCPPGALQELPWPLLCATAPPSITIAFSATGWLEADRPIDDAAVHVVTGPDLANATGDQRAALRRFRGAVVADRGRRPDLDRALDEADLLHIAAHGRFRPDNPMFSSVRLHDGEFALHELAGFDRVPSVVALAACDAGRSLHLERGAEQLGPARAWLEAGVESVIAPICAVPDESTAAMFGTFYELLPGSTPAEALAATWRQLADTEPALAATAAAFLCVGRGGPHLRASTQS